MTIVDMTMTTLYERLNQIGFNQKFIQDKILPDWWEKDCENTPGAIIELATYISRRLSLDFNSLLDIQSQPKFISNYQPKFKKQNNTNGQELTIAHYLVSHIAELTAYACKTKYQPINDLTIQKIRAQIFQQRKYVDLEGVLNFCWQQGIPVICFLELPEKAKKFHGMVASINNRPLIVVSLKDRSPSRLLFIIAHELGHIYKQHIDHSFLVDEKIELESIDFEEVEANEFALELLFGKPDMVYYTPHNYQAKQLAKYAQTISDRDSVDPGSVVWNYGWSKKHWAVTREAVKILEGTGINKLSKINNYLKTYLDWDQLNENNQDYLASMTGLLIEEIMGD